MMLTRETVPAQDAHRLGLVDRLCADGEVMASALEEARRLAQAPAEATRAVKALMIDSAGLVAALLLGLSTGGAVLLMVLGASASYIAVPAAMRVAVPEANPSIYLTLSLGVTFPFNLALGLPIYVSVARAVTGG